MKFEALLYLILGSILSPSFLPELHASGGTFIFVNSNSRAILDGRTGLPVEGGVAVAGLYYSTNLFDVPDPSVPADSFQMAATKSVGDGGIIFGGTVQISGTTSFQEVLLQVRVWYVGFATYEEALIDGRYPVGVSNLMGPVRLGGGIQPPTSLSTAGMLPTTLWPQNENNPPLTQAAAFKLRENRLLNGQLVAADPEGDSVMFSLVSPPSLGTVTLSSDGQFTYQPLADTVGTDQFSFKANDGTLESPPTVVSLIIIANGSVGRLVCNNGTQSRVLDGRTGLPVEGGVAMAGLYVTTNLTEVPRPDWPIDGFALLATAPVTVSSDPMSAGLFDAGVVELIDENPGTGVLIQVRVWTGGHADYEQAFHDPQALVSVSAALGPMVLGGPDPPWPAVADLEALQPMMLGSIPEYIPPRGKVAFKNSGGSLIMDGRSGAPVLTGVATAGLYFSTNLSAKPTPGQAGDPFVLVATTPISNDQDPRFWGRFDGGVVEIPNTEPGQLIQMQVRVWTTSAASYEEAALDPEALLGVSYRIDSLRLGGDTSVIPNLWEADELASIILRYAQGYHPPAAIRANFFVQVGGSYQGQLAGSDPDGDPLKFQLFFPPSLGNVVVYPNGYFQYDVPADSASGTDRFFFKVTDSYLTSESTAVVITVLPALNPGQGTISFGNSPATLINDYRTGLPMASGLALAGLYYTTNLNAVADPNRATDDFILVRTVSIRNGTFIGGSFAMPETYAGQEIQCQVRVWSWTYGSYEEAFHNKAEILGTTSVLRFNLSGGSLPAASIVISGGFTGILTPTFPLNVPPMAVAQISPEASLFLHDDVCYVLSGNHESSTVTFDGSASSDEDGDALAYFWYLDQDLIPLAEGEIVTVDLAVGSHWVTLVVDDGTTNSTTEIEFEILSAGEAAEVLLNELEEASIGRRQKRSLRSQIQAAIAAFDRGQSGTGISLLKVWQNRVHRKLGKRHPTTAQQMIDQARTIIDAVASFPPRRGSKPHELRH